MFLGFDSSLRQRTKLNLARSSAIGVVLRRWIIKNGGFFVEVDRQRPEFDLSWNQASWIAVVPRRGDGSELDLSSGNAMRIRGVVVVVVVAVAVWVVVHQYEFDLAFIAIHRAFVAAAGLLVQTGAPIHVEDSAWRTDMNVGDGARLTDDVGLTALNSYEVQSSPKSSVFACQHCISRLPDRIIANA